MVIGSLKECYERLLQLKTDQKRPNRLIMPNADTASVSSANDGDRQQPRQEVTSRKLLVAICNIEYVLNHSLAAICKRLSENGVKYAELILEVLLCQGLTLDVCPLTEVPPEAGQLPPIAREAVPDHEDGHAALID